MRCFVSLVPTKYHFVALVLCFLFRHILITVLLLISKSDYRNIRRRYKLEAAAARLPTILVII